MRATTIVLAIFLATAAAAVPVGHDTRKPGGKNVAAPPTLRDALELEAWMVEKEPAVLVPAERGKRVELVGRAMPRLAEDTWVPEAMRQRLVALDADSALAILDGTATARQEWVRDALAQNDLTPRATARRLMAEAVLENDPVVSDARRTAAAWAEVRGRSAARPNLRPPSGEHGMFDSLKKK